MPNLTIPATAKAFLSLSELAEDVLHLSRARLYELIRRGAMPQPVFCARTRRPMFTAVLIEQAQTVRRTGVGIDGSAVIFYRRDKASVTTGTAAPLRRRPRASAQPSRLAELIESLRGLGITKADEQSVGEAITQYFPSGLDGQQESDVIRVLFRHFRRRESV